MICVEPPDVYAQRAARPNSPQQPRPRPLPPLNDEEREIADMVAQHGGGPVLLMTVVNELARQCGWASIAERDAVRQAALHTIGGMIHVGLLRRVQRRFVLLPSAKICAHLC